MVFKTPYKAMPDSYAPNGAYLYSAMLNVQVSLSLPNSPRTKRFEAVIDSGASRTLFDSGLAAYLGIDMKSGEIEVTQGISGTEKVYLHEVTLYLPGGSVKSKVGFKENLPVAGLLGMKGFFEFFKVTFDPDLLHCGLQRIYRA